MANTIVAQPNRLANLPAELQLMILHEFVSESTQADQHALGTTTRALGNEVRRLNAEQPRHVTSIRISNEVMEHFVSAIRDEDAAYAMGFDVSTQRQEQAEALQGLLGYASRFGYLKVEVDADCECAFDLDMLPGELDTWDESGAPPELDGDAKLFLAEIDLSAKASCCLRPEWADLAIETVWTVPIWADLPIDTPMEGCAYSRARWLGVVEKALFEMLVWSVLMVKKAQSAAQGGRAAQPSSFADGLWTEGFVDTEV